MEDREASSRRVEHRAEAAERGQAPPPGGRARCDPGATPLFSLLFLAKAVRAACTFWAGCGKQPESRNLGFCLILT